MTKGQFQVAEFMKFFGQATPQKPVQMDEATAKLRAKLILEEAFETISKGLGLTTVIDIETGFDSVTISEDDLKNVNFGFIKKKEVDLVEYADGLADLAYVGEFGGAVAAGIDLEPIQEEVHASNMSKMWTEQELNEYYVANPDSVITVESAPVQDEKCFIVRRADGKIMKSPSYRPADLAPIIESQKA